ncbi:hypothetical protein FB451DRAFT_1053973, partial [Mycena latifolia]
ASANAHANASVSVNASIMIMTGGTSAVSASAAASGSGADANAEVDVEMSPPPPRPLSPSSLDGGEAANRPQKRARKAAPVKKPATKKGKGKRGHDVGEEVPGWAVTAQETLAQGECCEMWAVILEMWWERETAHQFQGPARGHTEGRPEQVARWTARARKGGPKPPIEDAGAFGKLWWKWYVVMNPEWRLASNMGRLDKLEDQEDWGALGNTGPNGMLNMLICLRWWCDALEEGDALAYQAALEEVYWGLETMA